MVVSRLPVQRRELAEFIVSRRRRLDPEDFGLSRRRRRTPGLRREEVASFAGVSLSWYTFLEQARDISVSTGVLDGIARALRLDAHEREHLFRLAGHPPSGAGGSRALQWSPTLQALLDALAPNPATIITPWFEYVAWNDPASRIVPNFLGHGTGPHNLVRYLFNDPAAMRVLEHWEGACTTSVALLRAAAARNPGSPEFERLVADLRVQSAGFAEMWERHEVAGRKSMSPVVVHPEVGRLTFREVDLLVADNPELQVVLFLPDDHDDTRAKLDYLVRQ